MNKWRVGEDRGSKQMDGCPLTVPFAALWKGVKGRLTEDIGIGV
jgi:hypothetical protein